MNPKTERLFRALEPLLLAWPITIGFVAAFVVAVAVGRS